MTEILYKSKNAIVIHKPSGVPSQPDRSGDRDAMTQAQDTLRSIGETESLYLVHRLDRVVSGLLVFARNKAAASALSALVSDGGIGKEYFAVVDGEGSEGVLSDYLLKNAALGKATVVAEGKKGAKLAKSEYKTQATVKTERGARSLVKVRLHTGRFHQIRAQFSSHGMSITGDKKYGSRDGAAKSPALFSHKLDIELLGERILVQRLPDITVYPWSLFSEEDYLR